TFIAGATAKVFTLTLMDDSLDEDSETVILGFSNFVNVSQTTGLGASYTLTIDDDDNAPSIAWTSSTYNVSENSTSMIITATLSSVSAKNIAVDYTVADISAINTVDYTLTDGMLTIPAGSSNTTITVLINDDSIFEPTESFSLNMAAYTNVSAGGTTVTTIDIADNDTGPTISWSPFSSTVSENSGSIQLTANLSSISGIAASIDYTVSGTATSGTDYSIVNTLTIEAGSTSNSVTLFIANDNIDENSEVIFVNMVAYTNVTAGIATVYTLTITDDDNPPIISFSPVSKISAESIGIVSINTILSLASEKSISVDYGMIGGTASSGIDYTLISGTLNFPPGSTSKTITCTVADDSIEEASETVILGLSNFVNVTETSGAGDSFTLTIEDNDSPIYISPIVDQTTNINTAISILLRVTQTEALPLTLYIQSSEIGLVALNNISITGTGAIANGNVYSLNVSGNIEDYTATIVPETDASGICQITLTVIAPTGVSDFSTFNLNITNGAPTISLLSPQTTLENLSVSLVFSITDTIDGVMSLTGVSSNGILVRSDGLQLTHSSLFEDASGYSLTVSASIPETITMTISPEENLFGNSEIIVTITNPSGLSATESFMLTVVDAAHRSIEFDGINDHVVSNATFSEEPTSAIAIEAWIYLYTNTTDMTILSYGNGSHESISFEHKSYNLEMRLKNASNSEFVSFKNLSADGMPVEKWHHVCVMWNNTQNKGYFFWNGQLRYEETFSSDTIGYSGTNKLYIGSLFGQNNWFNGKLDEIRFWKTGLPISTVREWMFKPLTDEHPYYDQLVAYYPISAVEGLIVYDTHSISHHGYLYENTIKGIGPVRSQLIAFNNWLNTNTNDWNDSTNWEAGFVPTVNNPGYAIINAGIRTPVLSAPSSVKNLVLTTGASYKASSSNPLNIYSKVYNKTDASNIGIGNSLTVYSSLDFKTDRIAPESVDYSITASPSATMNLQWEKATDDQTSSLDLQYAVVMSTYNQSCVDTLAHIAENISPCVIETVIPFQIVSGSGTGGTIRSAGGNLAEVDVSGLESGDYYFNILVRDEMNNLRVYEVVQSTQ
ncbi:Na-Ca exchanger/integrin-beta4 domain protein, partial [Candidatus Magnetomorum sp. HK-1]